MQRNKLHACVTDLILMGSIGHPTLCTVRGIKFHLAEKRRAENDSQILNGHGVFRGVLVYSFENSVIVQVRESDWRTGADGRGNI